MGNYKICHANRGCAMAHLKMVISLNDCFKREQIIVPLDRRSGQLKSTSPGCPTLSTPVAGVEEVFYTGTLFYFNFFLSPPVQQTFFRLLSSTPAGTLFQTGTSTSTPGVPVQMSQCRRGPPHLHRHPQGRQRSAGPEVRLYPPTLKISICCLNFTNGEVLSCGLKTLQRYRSLSIFSSL